MAHPRVAHLRARAFGEDDFVFVVAVAVDGRGVRGRMLARLGLPVLKAVLVLQNHWRARPAFAGQHSWARTTLNISPS